MLGVERRGRGRTPEQQAQLATPSYKLKKEKQDATNAELSSPSKDGTLVDPATVAVIGAVSDSGHFT